MSATAIIVLSVWVAGLIATVITYPLVFPKKDGDEDYLAHGIGAAIFWPLVLAALGVAMPFMAIDHYYHWANAKRKTTPVESSRQRVQRLKAETDAEMAREMLAQNTRWANNLRAQAASDLSQIDHNLSRVPEEKVRKNRFSIAKEAS